MEFLRVRLHLQVYDRPLEPTVNFLDAKWANVTNGCRANIKVLRQVTILASTELAQNRYQVSRAETAPGTYRKINGNDALVYGLISASQSAGKELFLAIR